MPLVVFIVGCGFGTKKFTLGSAGNMIIVSIGIAIASYGRREDGLKRYRRDLTGFVVIRG